MNILFDMWYDMYLYLTISKSNVVVVHWNAGKGRTGTCIACYLLFAGVFKTAEEAIEYYGK